MSKYFGDIIDFSSSAQRKGAQESNVALMQEPDPALPCIESVDELPETIQGALTALGWNELMEVQSYVLPYMLANRDLIVQSRTGSGKTGAFLLPLVETIKPEESGVQALILVPTRELARQVHSEFEKMRGTQPKLEGVRAVAIYGGAKYGPQIDAINNGVQVVVGTPGRILDLISTKRVLSLKDLRFLIFDEADEMLSMGFLPAMKELRRFLPSDRQSYMFSATIPYRVQTLAELFLKDFGYLSLSVGQVHIDSMEHRYYKVPPMGKDRALSTLIEMENPDSAFVFVNTKRDVEYVVQYLRNVGYSCDAISGDLKQKDREKAMDRLRTGKIRFLVATDVAARGIDISDLSHVFMYDVPKDPEYYVHRAGRTARAGKTGVSIVLTTKVDIKDLLEIGANYDLPLQQCEVPTAEVVAARVAERLSVMLEDKYRALTNMHKERLDRFVTLAESLSQEEPELLAMLLDQLYHDSLHVIEGAEEESTDDAPAESYEEKTQKNKNEDRKGGRQGGRSDNRGGGRSRNRPKRD